VSAAETGADDNSARPADSLLTTIADYVTSGPARSDDTRHTALWALLDAVGCGLQALSTSECRRFVDALAATADQAGPVPIPGTPLRLDPVTAAWAIGAANRWLDFNDTWLAREWGHPSDNAAPLLAAAAHANTRRHDDDQLRVSEVLDGLISAYEIQGVLAMDTALNRLGLDHVFLVRLASTAVSTRLLGGDRDAVVAATSQAFLDGAALRTYRHAPNTGPRKSWAAGDAASRAVRLALLTVAGEPGYPAALSTPTWGFDDVVLAGQPLGFGQALGAYVMDNILFKVAYPAEFHAQTALEAAVALHPLVRERLGEISRIHLRTTESGRRIISKTGPLRNAADRDHCLQYIAAVGLLQGTLSAEDYTDDRAADSRIEALRERMTVAEDEGFTTDYLDPDKRSIANSVEVFFEDGSSTGEVTVEYPLGHRRRRNEAWPLLEEKLLDAVGARLGPDRRAAVAELLAAPDRIHDMPVQEFLGLFRRPA